MEQIKTLKVEDVFTKVRDVFGEVYVGGSFAVKTLTNLPIQPSDIDFYIPYRFITRYMMKDIIENVIFRDYIINWTCLPQGNIEYYKMPGMRRRVSCEIYIPNLYGKAYMKFDFMLVENLTAEYLLKNQASTATECCLCLDFSDKGYHTRVSHAFKYTHNNKELILNTHPDWCTSLHAQKIRERFYNYKITEVYEARPKSTITEDYAILQNRKIIC